ncbi:hypothetical protein E8E12_008587 [Didymella heteroderae]|uniref:Peptidase A1 domain-containing protein n=1 Tax=Didymella heteroderae TaxID=1769908 RepID=A0A9P4WRY2_9PLEO|nr:hypothetical protein E8E12_008587 [Didymella heteroderae]
MTINNTNRPVSFLHALKQKGHIPSLSYGYQAGAAYRYNKTAGSLVLGGYDRSRRSNDTVTIPSATDVIVGVQSITAKLRGGSITVLNPGILAVLDTAVPELWLPHNVCDQIASVLNLTYHNDTERYTLTDAAHNALQSLNGSLEFRIGRDIHIDPAITVNIPYRAFDLQASYPIFNTTTRYFPLRKTTNKTGYALGRVFLQEAYLVVDWERDEFELSQAVFSDPMPEPEIITIQPNNDLTDTATKQGSAPNMSSGSIAGVVLGVLLFLATLAACWWLWRRKRRQEEQDKHQDTFRVLHGHGKQGPAELPLQVRIELENARNPRPEMYVPPKPHEMGAFNGENVRFEVWAPPVFYEMGDMSGKEVGGYRPDPDLMRKM